MAFGAAGIAAIEAVVGVFGRRACRRGSRRSGRRGGGWGFRHAKWMAGAVYISVIIVVENHGWLFLLERKWRAHDA